MSEQLTYLEAVEQLRVAYEQEKIQLTARISTLEVVVAQQSITIATQQKEIQELKETLVASISAIQKTQSEPYPYTHPIHRTV